MAPIIKSTMFGKYFKHVLVLTFLAGISYSLPQVKDAMAGTFEMQSAAAATSVSAIIKSPACPAGLTCIPSSSVVTKGCPKGYVCIMNTRTPSQQDLQFTVTTNKTEYAENEAVRIYAKAVNVSKDTIKMEFGGCQTAYSVAYFDSEKTDKCTTQVSYVSIKPGESYLWRMEHSPSRYRIPAGSYKVEVRLLSAKGDLISATAPITVKGQVGQPTIRVISPNGGETYRTNEVINVGYSGENLSDTLKVYLYSPIHGNVAEATGQYGEPLGTGKGTINIGQLKNTPPHFTGQFKVTLCDEKNVMPSQLGKPLCDTSDNFFTIIAAETPTQPSITVVSPNGGETLIAGSTFEIKWKYSSNIMENLTKFSVHLIDSNGKIVTGGIGDNLGTPVIVIGDYYMWQVSPNLPVGKYKVVV